MKINITEQIKLYLCDPEHEHACRLIGVESMKVDAISFGDLYTVDQIAQMAEDEGMNTWITYRGNWVIESNEIGGSFILREIPNGHVVLEAADGDELNG